ncbi:MAG: CTP synthase [Treponema sp.]|jgi:CTP synthase|nr:CTP synthase [Treponema sp.]
MNKFIFVSGGVCSSLGKGIAASSIGALLESRGLNVRMVKCDPYINVDAGTMSPYQHGEVYVTDDGAETDLDLGNYARFTKGRLGKANSITTGQVYEAVIRKEREGRYEGRCVQVIPHITDEIKSRIIAVLEEDNDTDVVIVEIGGTVGDIESIPFLEAARQIIHEWGRINAISVHLTLIPEVSGGELKTKPTQHSVKTMQETGIQPDILICRAPVMLDDETRRKIALFTNVDLDAVFTSPNIDTTVYEEPIIFFNQKLDQVVLRKMSVESRHADMRLWRSMMELFAARKGNVRIGIVGQYIELHDAYKSLYEALFHSSLECGVEVELVKIDAYALEKAENADNILGAPERQLDGILVPGDFGGQGLNGMVKAVSWARENKIPYFGIGMGLQVMVIDWARNVLNLSIEESNAVISHGENMQPGMNEIVIEDNSRIMTAYGKKRIQERRRYRYEIFDKYRDKITASGLKFTALCIAGLLVECVEWSAGYPWGVAVQFHPEYKSKPMSASPLFREFIAAVKMSKSEK